MGAESWVVVFCLRGSETSHMMFLSKAYKLIRENEGAVELAGSSCRHFWHVEVATVLSKYWMNEEHDTRCSQQILFCFLVSVVFQSERNEQF